MPVRHGVEGREARRKAKKRDHQGLLKVERCACVYVCVHARVCGYVLLHSVDVVNLAHSLGKVYAWALSAPQTGKSFMRETMSKMTNVAFPNAVL